MRSAKKILRLLSKKLKPAPKKGSRIKHQILGHNRKNLVIYLGGGFKFFLFSPLLGEDSHFD